MRTKLNFLPVLVICVALIAGCAGVTGIIYGPDTSPEQTKAYIYEDAYAVGAIFSRNANSEQIAALIAEAELAPYALITHQFLDALDDNRTKDAILFFALTRLYRRLGIDPNAELLDLSGLDYELVKLASEGYLAGVKSRLI